MRVHPSHARLRRHGLPWLGDGSVTRDVRTVEGSLADVLEGVCATTSALRRRANRRGRPCAGSGRVVPHVQPPCAGADPARRQRPCRPGDRGRGAREAHEGFDARFSATAREYRYAIDTGPAADPFTARYVWHRPGELSIGRMRAAARHLVGEHDFTSFCRHPGTGQAHGPRPPAGLASRARATRDLRLPRQRVPPPDGPDGRRDARAGRRGQAGAARTSNHAGGSERSRAVAAGAGARAHARTSGLRRRVRGPAVAVKRASFDGVAFPQVALPIGRDARPISHV